MSNYYHPIDPDCVTHITEWAKEKRVFRDIQHALLCQLWIDTGLSPEELSYLEWKDVDWINHAVNNVPLRDVTMIDFEIWRNIVLRIEAKNQLIPQTYIFLLSYDQQFFTTSLYPGKVLTPTNVTRILLDLWAITVEIDTWIEAKRRAERLERKAKQQQKRKQKQVNPETKKASNQQVNFKRNPHVHTQEDEHKEPILTDFARREMEKIAQRKAKEVPPKNIYKASWFFCRVCKVYHPIDMLDYTNRWGSEFCRLGRGWRKSRTNLPDRYEFAELPSEVRDAYFRTESLA